jgi:hypothetical protein
MQHQKNLKSKNSSQHLVKPDSKRPADRSDSFWPQFWARRHPLAVWSWTALLRPWAAPWNSLIPGNVFSKASQRLYVALRHDHSLLISFGEELCLFLRQLISAVSGVVRVLGLDVWRRRRSLGTHAWLRQGRLVHFAGFPRCRASRVFLFCFRSLINLCLFLATHVAAAGRRRRIGGSGLSLSAGRSRCTAGRAVVLFEEARDAGLERWASDKLSLRLVILGGLGPVDLKR